MSSTSWTAKKERIFIEALRDGHTISQACRTANLPRSTVYHRRTLQPTFAEAWDDAEDEGSDVMEQEAFRRAVHGVDKPITHQGIITDTVKEYSDTLLIFLLKGRKPNKFRERIDNTHTGPDGGAIVIQTVTIEKPEA